MSSRLIWQPDSHRAAPRAFFLLWCLALIAAPWVAAAGLVPARTQWYENRAPEPWPAAPDDTREVNTYPARFESAFTDRLGVRGYLIGLHAWLKYKVFATSPSDAVLVGKEGWLFHNLGANIADHQGRLVLSDADKRKLRLVFEERRDWLAERGIPYLVAIVPEKQTVYDAQVPAWVGDRQGPSAREQLLAYLDEVGSTLDVLDLTPVLRDAAQHAAPGPDQLYYTTDTHWNQQGALIGYRAILARLREREPTIPPALESDDFARTLVDLHTNLNKMLGITDTEPSPEFAPVGGWRFSDMPLDRPAMQRISKKGVAVVREIPDAEGALPTMHFLADSFAGWNSRLLANHFARSTLTNTWGSGWTHRDHFPAGLLAEEHPDVVLSQLAEGRLRVGPSPALGGGEVAPPRAALRVRSLASGPPPLRPSVSSSLFLCASPTIRYINP